MRVSEMSRSRVDCSTCEREGRGQVATRCKRSPDLRLGGFQRSCIPMKRLIRLRAVAALTLGLALRGGGQAVRAHWQRAGEGVLRAALYGQRAQPCWTARLAHWLLRARAGRLAHPAGPVSNAGLSPAARSRKPGRGDAARPGGAGPQPCAQDRKGCRTLLYARRDRCGFAQGQRLGTSLLRRSRRLDKTNTLQRMALCMPGR